MPAIKLKIAGLLLLLVALNSQALTLGRMRGAALVGQALDLSIQVQADAGESPGVQCFEVDVFYADTRQDASRVQLSVEPAQAQRYNVRIQSGNLVDEPVVTLYLRAGCAQKTSRRYVLLADIASEQPASTATRIPPVPLLTAATEPGAGASNSGTTGVSSASGIGRNTVSQPASARPRSVARKARSARPARVPSTARAARATRPDVAAAPTPPSSAAGEKLLAGRSAGQSRLKLDPLELSPSADRAATPEAAPASAPAELAAREAQRLQSLEVSVKDLLTVATRNEASLQDLKMRLQQAEAERYRNPLVYALGAVLLACLGALVWLLLRRGRPSAVSEASGWSGAGKIRVGRDSVTSRSLVQSPDSVSPARSSAALPLERVTGASALLPASGPAPGQGRLEGGSERTLQQTMPTGPGGLPGANGQAPNTQVDVSLVEMSESTFDHLMQTGASHSAVRKPREAEPTMPVLPAPRRSINSDELFDIRQQAEFFVSLGQTDQAVRVLENRISEHGEASPLAYLDLLKIFHSLGLRADFRQVREDFNLLFNARVPEFSNFHEEGRGLEQYPAVLAEITAAWATPNVFASIELWLFRDQWKTQRDFLDLAAFRDLLLLHAVAQTALAPVNSTLGQATVLDNRSTIPLASAFGASPGVIGGVAAGAPVDVPSPSLDGEVDLDIDLTDLRVAKTWAGPSTAPAVKPAAGTPSELDNLIDFDLGNPPADTTTKSRR